MQAELEASAIRDITSQALDMLPYPSSSVVVAALYVLAEAEGISVSMIQCGSRPCLNVLKVKGGKRQSTPASKRRTVTGGITRSPPTHISAQLSA